MECSGRRVATLRFEEGFANAFKPRATPVHGGRFIWYSKAHDYTVVTSESGPFNRAFGDDKGRVFVSGLADSGTRVMTVFNNVPAGVRLFVSLRNATSNPRRTIEVALTESDVGPFSPVKPSEEIEGESVAELVMTNGTAIAVWEITSRKEGVAGWVEFGVFVRFKSDPRRNSPALGTACVTGDLEPGTTVTIASPNHAVPRFQTLSDVVPLFAIAP